MESHGQLVTSLGKLPGSETTKLLFDNTKNFMTCAALYAAGALAVRHANGNTDWLPVWLSHFAGWGVVAMAIGLALMNLLDGVRHLSRSSHPRVLMALFIFAYVVASARVMTLVAALRLAGFSDK